MDQSFLDIGRHLKELRTRRGMTQPELSAASGVGLGVIRKIEQGKTVQMEAYHAIARVFGLKTLAFVPSSAGATRYKDLDEENLALAGWRNAIAPALGLGGVAIGAHQHDRLDLQGLQRGLRSMVTAYRSAQYDLVSQTVPELIRSAQFHVDAVPEAQRLQAMELRCELFQLAGQYLTQVRQLDLALSAFNAAIQDSLLLPPSLGATLVVGQSWVLTRQGRFNEVEQLCSVTADQVEPPMRDGDAYAFGVWGRLLVTAACAAARNNRPEEAKEYMSVASAAGARIGEDEVMLNGHMPFGALTAHLKRAEVELIGGHPDRTLDLWEHLPRAVPYSSKGYQRQVLDYAHSLALTGKRERATDIVDQLRRDAPEWLVHQRYARIILRDILSGRKRKYTEQQRVLIRFLGMQNESTT